jgi:hypothetical protein
MKAIGIIRPDMLQNFTNRVERYYSDATRQKDLNDIPSLKYHYLGSLAHER